MTSQHVKRATRPPPGARRKRAIASRALFPLATVFAILAMPLGLALPRTFSSLAMPAAHGHEMLFGFVLAVIAGFLATKVTTAMIWTLVITWLVARCAGAFGPLAPLAGLAFPLSVVAATVPPLFAGAKRAQNRIVPLVVTTLLAIDCAWWASLWFELHWQQRLLLLTVDLLVLLILIVGGRALQAAVGGHLERSGIKRRDPVRRGYELPLAALIGTMFVCDAFGWAAAAGACALAAAALNVHRVVPWQLHYTLAHPRLWTLALAYLWLIAGLALKGCAQSGLGIPVTGMLHAITIGAIGTSTLVMMARTTVLRARLPLEDFRDIGAAAVLLSVAAISRVLATLLPPVTGMLISIAAACWSSAFLILLIRLLVVARHERMRRVSGT